MKYCAQFMGAFVVATLAGVAVIFPGAVDARGAAGVAVEWMEIGLDAADPRFFWDGVIMLA